VKLYKNALSIRLTVDNSRSTSAKNMVGVSLKKS